MSGSEATSSDDLLIQRAQRGEPGALDDLIRRKYRLIHRWALVKTGDADDAEDVTQRVLIQLFGKLGTFRGRSSFDSWLYRITSNAAGELHRRRGARERALAKWGEKNMDRSTGPGAGVDAAGVEHRVLARIAGSEAAEVVHAFFSALPGKQREVFDLVELQGRTAAEAAEMLDMNASTVRVHLLRARRGLRARIIEHHPAFAEDYT